MDCKQNKQITPENYLAREILMVSPDYFEWDAATSADNEFQQKIEVNKVTLFQEFDTMGKQLAELGVTVHRFATVDSRCVDAVFPNNWFSTHKNEEGKGILVYYPMRTPNRQLESRQNPKMNEFLEQRYETIIDLRNYESQGKALEGTGVFIFDLQRRLIFMAQSQRADVEVAQDFLLKFNSHFAKPFQLVVFKAQNPDTKNEIYHTNVIMAMMGNKILVCSECIKPDPDFDLISFLKSQYEEVLEVSFSTIKRYGGNAIQLYSPLKNQPFVAISKTGAQAVREQNVNFGSEVLEIDIELIQNVGGGSVRCMIAEIF